MRWFSLACFACTLFSGCSDPIVPVDTTPLLGNYSITITANGKSDGDTVTINRGSDNYVLLNFVFGISQVRCAVGGSGSLTLPRQVLHVSHSTGVADGMATGTGKIDAEGKIELEIDLMTPGIGPSDGGAGPVVYQIAGMRN